MNDKQLIPQDRFPDLKHLTFQEVYNAFLSFEVIRGFMVTEMVLGMHAEGLAGFESLTLVHMDTGAKIRMNRDGWEIED